ncbi:serine proteinase inhibitor 6 [Penaeus vannamei]|uniref:Serine proteinase inhibitor 6 n=1 Tax=Penaeus vannamei TaxID=6689 RepID=A0A3R7MQC8_PENVA|nr:serine proteinase inhibitor 6 [Penaeus vannamei]
MERERAGCVHRNFQNLPTFAHPHSFRWRRVRCSALVLDQGFGFLIPGFCLNALSLELKSLYPYLSATKLKERQNKTGTQVGTARRSCMEPVDVRAAKGKDVCRLLSLVSKMNARGVVVAMAVAAALVAVCSGQINRCFPGEKLEFAEAEFSGRVEIFGLSLFQQLSQSVQGNLFISPYSIWSALTLAYFGSEGNTREQLESALNLKSKTHTYFNWGGLRLLLLRAPEGEGVTFNSLNRAYMNERLNLNRCVSNILPDLQLMDFSRPSVAVETINNDVSVATEGRIQNFIQNLLPNTNFVLINAVFFKGLWQSQFEVEQTRTQEFLIPPGRSGGNVQMMSQSGRFNYGNVPSLEAKILELPYENSSVSMFILLPNDISTDSIT